MHFAQVEIQVRFITKSLHLLQNTPSCPHYQDRVPTGLLMLSNWKGS